MSKKIFIFLFLVMCFVSIYNINKTYALFESKKTHFMTSPIAKWEIKVNEKGLNTEETILIDNLNWNETEYVKEGKVAPDMNGYFDLLIDPSKTEVSVRYDLIFDFSNLNNENLKVESIKNLEDFPLTKTDKNTYTGIIPLTDIENAITHTIRVNISWIHEEENNENDSIIGMSPTDVIEIPVNIRVSQYLGEEITEYVEEPVGQE